MKKLLKNTLKVIGTLFGAPFILGYYVVTRLVKKSKPLTKKGIALMIVSGLITVSSFASIVSTDSKEPVGTRPGGTTGNKVEAPKEPSEIKFVYSDGSGVTFYYDTDGKFTHSTSHDVDWEVRGETEDHMLDFYQEIINTGAAPYKNGTYDMDKLDWDKLYPPSEEELAHEEWLDGLFSSWDGSSYRLSYAVKNDLNDPKSFDHSKTTYRVLRTQEDVDDVMSVLLENEINPGTLEIGDVYVFMEFRAKNGFGALIKGYAIGIHRYETDGLSYKILN